jgi:hypothetical protein
MQVLTSAVHLVHPATKSHWAANGEVWHHVWPEMGTSIGEVRDGMQSISRWDSEEEGRSWNHLYGCIWSTYLIRLGCDVQTSLIRMAAKSSVTDRGKGTEIVNILSPIQFISFLVDLLCCNVSITQPQATRLSPARSGNAAELNG